jgi:POT family proton-dependent oligopeptide transporter
MTTENNDSLAQIQNFDGKYPKQLWYLFFSEMWERFCFYGMRGMLTFFMVNQLMMKEDVANLQYGATQAFVYAFTFIGGLFADKILGFRRSLFWGGILMIVGSLILATDPEKFFFLGISFTIIGTGFFKPNISTMVGQLYHEGDPRRDAGFSLFYSGINVGALLGGYACVAIGKGQMLSTLIPSDKTWNVAFGLAAVVMTISLLTFIFTQKSMGTIGLSPFANDENGKSKAWYEYAVYLGSLAVIPVIMKMVAKTEYTDYFMYTIGPVAIIYVIVQALKYDWQVQKKLIAAMVFIVFSIFFWAFFEQSGGSLSLFAANNLDNNLLGGLVTADPNGVNNAANSLFVIILAPLIGLLWIFLSKRNKEPNTIVKFGLGFIFLAMAFYVFYTTRFFANLQGTTSLDVFTTAYLIITLGELCLSPIGLSIMTKLSPEKMQGVMMGMWFLASAYGQYVAGILGAGMTSPNENATASEKLISYTDGYQQLSIYALICGLVLILIAPQVRKLMGNVK